MKFDYEILKNEYMSISASALLRVIQNDNMPILDLLVREITQNSLDAYLDGAKSVDVEINSGKFDTYQLNSKFGEVGTKIYNKYKEQIDCNKINTFISFSDKNTTGLTGPINKNEVENNKYGKFMNLVFNIGKAQDLEGAGGSWGYGKSVYYRAGIGLVGFYTRIKEENIYKSRLILALVENENDSQIVNSLDNNKVKTGIMWLGTKKNGILNPIVDEDEIKEFLDIFNIKPYSNNETGTTIIIPYIDEELLLSKTYYNNKKDDYKKAVWCNNINSYIEVALQRWYAPRLMNPYYDKGPYLRVSINDQMMNYMDFLPLFKIIQRLYIYPNKNLLDRNDIKILSEDITLRDSFESKGIAGRIVYTKLSKEELGGESTENPYRQIFNNNDFGQNSSNPAIITFCRKPGMLLKYDIGEAWSNGINNNSLDNYIIGLFIPNSDKDFFIKETNGKKYIFEEYLRESEKADHCHWDDLPNYKIIKKIQKNIQNKINNTFLEKEDVIVVNGIGSKLNSKLTELFLPAVGFGKRANKRIKKGKKERKEDIYKAPKTNSNIEFLQETVRRNRMKNQVSEDFCIHVTKNDLYIHNEIFINGEDKNISATEWEEHISKKRFPIEIIKFEVLSKDTIEDIEYIKRGILTSFIDEIKLQDLNVKKAFSEKGTWCGWKIRLNSNLDKKIINCRITYKYLDNRYLCNVERIKGGNIDE